MKKTLLTLTLVVASVAAFAQGKVTFGNDSNHYFVLGKTLAADAAIGGGVASTAGNTVSGTVGAIPVSPLPSGVTLVAALYAGTSSGNLTLATSYLLNAANWSQAGKPKAYGIQLAGVPGGALAYLRVDVYDSAYANGLAAKSAGSYYGTSTEFTMTPGASISYPSIYAAGGTTWAAGNLVIDAVPEPSTFALAGLGAAAMLIFRRRK